MDFAAVANEVLRTKGYSEREASVTHDGETLHLAGTHVGPFSGRATDVLQVVRMLGEREEIADER